MLKRIISIILIFGLLAAAGYLLLMRFGPGRHVYAVDSPGNAEKCEGEIRFAVIGDFGQAGSAEEDVAALVSGWQPDFITTLGDNNYPNGKASTIDENIGRYFAGFIHPYQGAYGPGAAQNRFFPSLGNHDYLTTDAQPYLDYFTLPGNERYYDVRRGPVHLFVLNSNWQEPDGRALDSVQARWFSDGISASQAPWKIVVLHHTPYASVRQHGSQEIMQWDFEGLGATAVLAGHEHLYERIERDGVTYITNGLGGRRRVYPFGQPIEGSAVRYNQDFGALLVTAGETCINFSFVNRDEAIIDSHTLRKE